MLIARDQAGATRPKVILKVLTEAGLPAIPEVHVELPAGDVAECRVVRRPVASDRAHSTRSSRPDTYRDWIEVSEAKRKQVVKSKHLRERVVMLPLKALPLRVAKFDLVLRGGLLQAVRAKHAMLTRKVLFTCNTCRERFPAFHPAYEPPEDYKLDRLKRGADGVAACNVEVAEWDELPPLEAPEEDLLVAEEHSGCCWRCHVDVQEERGRHGVDTESVVVAKFGGRNHIDPVWRFPRGGLAALFQAASLAEPMFVARGTCRCRS